MVDAQPGDAALQLTQTGDLVISSVSCIVLVSMLGFAALFGTAHAQTNPTQPSSDPFKRISEVRNSSISASEQVVRN